MFAMQKLKDTFTVFQLNLWHGCTKVPNGDQGIIDVLDQMDADVSFSVRNQRTENSLPSCDQKSMRREENITMWNV